MAISASRYLLRPLGPSEQYFWLSNQNSSKHFVFAAQILGSATDGAWSSAIAAAQLRHPLLRVSIECDRDGKPCFVEHPDHSIPVQIFAKGQVPRWEAQIAHEVSTPFPLSGSLLTRVSLLKSDAGCTLILSMHHSIGDGLSAAFVIRDIIQALSGVEIQPLKLTAPQEDLCQAPPSFAPTPSPQVYPPAALLRRTVEGPSVQALKLSEDLTRKLRSRAHEANATVHGALVAALAFAGRRLCLEWRVHPTRVVSPVNNRPRLGLEDECALAIVFPSDAYAPETEDQLWDVARAVRSDLAPVGTPSGLNTVYSGLRQLIAPSPSVAEIAAFELQVCACEGMVSNLGVLPFETTFGMFKLEALWGPSVFVGIEGEQMIGATTLNGALHLLHSSYTPITKLLNKMQDVLQSMAR